MADSCLVHPARPPPWPTSMKASQRLVDKSAFGMEATSVCVPRGCVPCWPHCSGGRSHGKNKNNRITRGDGRPLCDNELILYVMKTNLAIIPQRSPRVRPYNSLAPGRRAAARPAASHGSGPPRHSISGAASPDVSPHEEIMAPPCEVDNGSSFMK